MMSPYPYNPYEFYDPNRPCIEPIPESDSDDEGEMPIIPITPIAQPENPQWSTSITLTKKKSWHRKFPTMSRKDFSFKKRRLSLGTYGPDRLRFDSLNPAPRPADWRPDYVPPHSAKSHRFSLRAKSGQNPGIAGKITYKLHPFLQYISPTRTPLAYDIRQNPNYSNMQYLTVPRPGNQIDWCQVATTPSVHELHLYHRRLPWIITIRATQTNGITLGDVFDQIHQSLSVRVTQQEVYNSSLNASDREEIATACYYRNGSAGTVGGPMLRVDFLGFEVVFLGLVKGKHGLWEMMTQSAQV
ncbi:hypothetical protein H0H93_012631 [Arthromyces matolae]|nr:hypothetical protein H0H93_012631 [Arthromyces matolae]